MYQLNNLFYGELDLSGGDITSGASTITLSSGDVANLEITPTATDPALFMIWDKAYETGGAARRAGGKVELISVTGKDEMADTLTAGTRGFSNTTAQSYNSADSTTYGIVQVSADELFDNLLISGSSNTIVDRAGNTLNTINAPTMLQIGGTGIVEGVKVADQWRLNTNFTGDAIPITSNLEQVDTDGFGGIGSAMSETSGVFTFPSTGVYRIDFGFTGNYTGDARYIEGGIQTTTDGSSYSDASMARIFIQETQSAGTYNNGYCSFIFDVTSTSTHKCRFIIDALGVGVTINGSTGQNLTHMTFIRLGDT